RAVPARPAVRRATLLQSDDHRPRADHDLRRDYAGVRRLRELDGAADDRRAGHGAAAPQQLVVLAAAVRDDAAADDVLHAGRRVRLRLDDVSAAVAADRRRAAVLDLRDPPARPVVDHGVDQHHRHGAELAGAGDGADEDADVRLDVADHRLPDAARDAG